jgi:membrane-associated protein
VDIITPYIIAFGYAGIFITLFAESGFFLGFFLPGDSLLFTAGILASQGIFNVWYLFILGAIAAIAGDSFGYWMGTTFGPKLFNRDDSFLFKKEYVDRTEAFFVKHGVKTIVLARFVPIVRTFAPILAGMGSMRYRTFVTYNIIGGILWTGGFLGISYYLGIKVPGIGHYLEYIILAIIVASVVPIAIDFMRKK